MFGDGPLGREICGEEADITALPATAIHEFWRSVYRPANTV
jgi:Predicted Zn-dependent peptidases